MSVVGISFGNESCYVAVACRGGVETVDNDYSLRATPSFVAFGEKQRLLGVAAKNQTVTNLGNTLCGFKRFLGRKINDPIVNDEASKLAVPVVPINEGGIGFQVTYQTENHVFTPEQITAMLFTKLKKTAEIALQKPVKDCVISVPSYFTNSQRGALREAAIIAGLNSLQLLNDTAAAAINYGMYKMKELPGSNDPPRKVIFVDFGHTGLQVSAAEFLKGAIKILACTSDSNLGGRNFDEILMKYFCGDFRERYNILPETNMRAFVRLLGEIQKLRKQMSANSTKLPLTIDCFMNEKDVISYMDRATFENMSSNLLHRVEVCLQNCLTDSKWDPKDIHSVEIVGGMTRMPAVKQLIEKVFHKIPSATLNQDEAVATGCALRCAMMSPVYLTQNISIRDVHPYAITLSWHEITPDGRSGSVELFPPYQQIPCSKILTIPVKSPFVFMLDYKPPVSVSEIRIGQYLVEGGFENPTPEENVEVKIKAKIDINGNLKIDSVLKVHLVAVNAQSQLQEGEDEINMSQGDLQQGTSNDPIMVDGEGTAEAETKVSPTNKVTALLFQKDGSRHSEQLDSLNQCVELECEMVNDDQKETDRINARNTLEEYIYDLREKLESVLKPYIEETGRAKLFDSMQEIEDWLYSEGCDESKTVYCQHLNNLKKSAEPIKELLKDDQERHVALKALEEAVSAGNKIDEDVEEYKYLTAEHKSKVKNIVKNMSTWIVETIEKNFGTSKSIPAPISAAEIRRQTEDFIKTLNSILNKPKPKATLKSEVDTSSVTEQEYVNTMNANIPAPSSQDMHIDTETDIVDHSQTSGGLRMDLDNPDVD